MITAAVTNLSRSRVWRSIVLMLASFIFLAFLAKSAFLLVPLAAFLLFCYGALAIRERGWTRAAAWSIPAAILAYVWLKKYTFLPDRFFLHLPYFTLGLSYIFFRVMHLLIEALTLLKIRTADGPALTNRYALVVYATTMAVIALLVTVVLNQPAPGIVYKAF